MNEYTTSPSQVGSDHADSAPDTLMTDFTHAVRCAVGNDQDARRREKIREELVREYFTQEQIDREQKASSSPRNLLLKLCKLG